MALIKINVQSVLTATPKANNAKSIVHNSRNTVISVANQLDRKILARNGISEKFNTVSTNLLSIEKRINNIIKVAEYGVNSYVNTESAIIKKKNQINSNIAVYAKISNGSGAVSAFRSEPTKVSKKTPSAEERRKKAKTWKMILNGVCIVGSVAAIALSGGAATPLVIGTVSAISGVIVSGGENLIDQYAEDGRTSDFDWGSVGKDAIIGGVSGFVSGYVGAGVGDKVTKITRSTSLASNWLNSSSRGTRLVTGAVIGSISEVSSGIVERGTETTIEGVLKNDFSIDKVVDEAFDKKQMAFDAVVGGFSEAKTENKQYESDMVSRKFNESNNPVAHAAERGYEVKPSAKNGSLDYSGSDYIVKNADNKEVIITIEMTGSRSGDKKAAYDIMEKEFGLSRDSFDDCSWHHLDDYNIRDNTVTMQLVKKEAHSGIRHSGGVRMFEEFWGVKYGS